MTYFEARHKAIYVVYYGNGNPGEHRNSQKEVKNLEIWREGASEKKSLLITFAENKFCDLFSFMLSIL